MAGPSIQIHSTVAPVRTTRPVLGIDIDVLDLQAATQQLLAWARARERRVVCICNVHSIITAQQQDAFRAAVASADMVTADGAPVAWMLRRQGATAQRRVCGPDLMLAYCQAAAAAGEPVFLLGSTEDTLNKLKGNLHARWPALRIAGTLSPPFRTLTDSDNQAIARAIAASGASSVWVSLGCPKQELWMAANRDRVAAPMVGVGAAFDFHAGNVQRAPLWMRQAGLEWLHRLFSEPSRLWRRYLVTNTLFLAGAARQLWRLR
jgi:N-acetylglucosaminyldiphosphoundecaprenol N-acetyl-beta-D-mannosaminyltransferase